MVNRWDEIKVKVRGRAGSPYYQLVWIDPASGKERWQSSRVEVGGKKQRAIAQRAAAKKEAELAAGNHVDRRNLWSDFRERYDRDHLRNLSRNHQRHVNVSLDAFEAACQPTWLHAIDAESVARFEAYLRDERQLSPTAQKNYLGDLAACLNWAVDVAKIVPRVPKIRTPRRAKSGKRKSRGRPVTEEEFQMMLDAAVITRPKDFARWRYFMRGCYTGGLRVSEAAVLSWDGSTGLSVTTAGRHPKLRMLAEWHKGDRDILLPIAPELWSLLQETSPDKRTGLCFPLLSTARYNHGAPLSLNKISCTIADIGRAADVLVNPLAGEYASAHDLRRSFGARWSLRVKPVVLQQLMRHRSIQTTLDYYVEHDADDLGDILWSAVAPDPAEPPTAAKPERKRSGSKTGSNPAIRVYNPEKHRRKQA